MTEVIHKLNITTEAAFDLCECLGMEIDRRALKKEVEEYIKHMTASGRLPWWGYFRCDYLDEESGRLLKLFVYKGFRLGPMQYWNLAGVCESGDWTQDTEDEGYIRRWLNTTTDELSEESDWVVGYRVNKIIKETEKTVFENVLAEVANEFEHKRDKEDAEKLVFLQSVYFECRGQRFEKNRRRNRAIHKRIKRN